jgi:SAM-dependent methyltransferase
VDKETWIRQDGSKLSEYEMDLYLGKKTDLLSLKKNIVEKIKKNLDYYRSSRTELYMQPEMEDVSACPVCFHTAANTIDKATIYGANYVQCKNCTHVYVIKRPVQKAIHNFYLNNVTYAATYTDKKAAESRLNAIAVPWANWTIEVFKKKYKRMPKKVLDVGSGAGHFIEAIRRQGIEANGIELSESSRDFAREIWGFEMDGRNFVDVAIEYEDYDIITFWGLLEHTPNPNEILKAAWDILNKGNQQGIVISKLPRWDSLSSAAQRLSTDSVIRHLDPMGHIMAFTDASAAEIYTRNGFSPFAAWYYGMDVYETLMQIGNKIDSYDHFTKTGNLQMELQQFIDEARYSDGLTLVGAV